MFTEVKFRSKKKNVSCLETLSPKKSNTVLKTTQKFNIFTCDICLKSYIVIPIDSFDDLMAIPLSFEQNEEKIELLLKG